ncbi:MAG: DUF4159 domain-containing protein [Alphaproteobacteria bacterium]
MLTLGSLAFAAPWVLGALAALPALWWLLRVTPPNPRRLRFPAVRLLLTLRQEDETPARTPLWLLALRVVLVALIIVALARPILNPGQPLTGNGPLVIAIDDGWASARNWTERQGHLTALIDHAEREARQVVLVMTAPRPGQKAANILGPTDAPAMREHVLGLAPKPWPVDRRGVLDDLARLPIAGTADVWWLSDGLEDGAARDFAAGLRRLGTVTMIDDRPERRARLMLPAVAETNGLIAHAMRAASDAAEEAQIRGLAEDGRILLREPLRFPTGETTASTTLTLPAEVRNQLVRLEIEGEASAGAVVLSDERWRRRLVGLTVLKAGERDLPLLGELYYLERALAPFSETRSGTLETLLAQPLSLLVLPDTAALSDPEVQKLSAWIQSGGVLVRFSGPRLAQGGDALTPVALRQGGRTLGGAMSWGQAARLAPFPPTSPFAGLSIPSDIEVERQVLAQPSADLDAKTWARLQDGTPLVTGERRGKGWLVLFHVTANPEWSSLAISGLFVEMLQRLVGLSTGITQEGTVASLPPVEILDGFGHLKAPTSGIRPIPSRDFAQAKASPETPPGLYGAAGARRALNLSNSVTSLVGLPTLPDGITRRTFGARGEIDLMPWILLAALVLVFADLVISLVLRGLLPNPLPWARARQDAETGGNPPRSDRPEGGPRRAQRAALFFLLVLATAAAPSSVRAQSDSEPPNALKAANQMRLAYVRTGVPEVDRVSRAGLQGLRRILQERTAVELGDTAEVDPVTDELAFYPFLYWPVVRATQPLGADTASKVYAYTRNGGVILFDTQDQQTSGMGVGGNSATEVRAVQRLLGRLGLAPLVPVPPEHVLGRSFYLLSDYPGRWAGGTVWLEAVDDSGNREAVSSVIVGSNDWAGAWAADDQGRPVFPVVPGGEKQREFAYRFGVNLMMYVLTGNYKSDQVHLRFILERLGQ